MALEPGLLPETGVMPRSGFFAGILEIKHLKKTWPEKVGTARSKGSVGPCMKKKKSVQLSRVKAVNRTSSTQHMYGSLPPSQFPGLWKGRWNMKGHWVPGNCMLLSWTLPKTLPWKRLSEFWEQHSKQRYNVKGNAWIWMGLLVLPILARRFQTHLLPQPVLPAWEINIIFSTSQMW